MVVCACVYMYVCCVCVHVYVCMRVCACTHALQEQMPILLSVWDSSAKPQDPPGPRRPGTGARGPCRGARGGGPLFTTSPWSGAWAGRSGLAGGPPRASPTSRVGHLAAHPGPSHQTLRGHQPGGLHEDALPQARDGESGRERRDRRSRPGTHGPPRGPPPPWSHPPRHSAPRAS